MPAFADKCFLIRRQSFAGQHAAVDGAPVFWDFGKDVVVAAPEYRCLMGDLVVVQVTAAGGDVAHRGVEHGDGGGCVVDELAHPGFADAQGRFGLLTAGNVADDAGEAALIAGAGCAEREFGSEFRAVAAGGGKFACRRADHARLRAGSEAGYVNFMLRCPVGGHQYTDVLADQLVHAVIAEHFERGGIDRLDQAVGASDDDGVGGGVDDGVKLRPAVR